MAREGAPDSARYLQHAAQLDRSAASARRFAELELALLTKWQQPGDAPDTGP
jgi:hypothetical protein